MEDIVADDVVISDEEVIRTDAVTGAETRLTRFQVRTARQLTSADDALAGLDRDGVIFAVNSKSGRAALVVQGLTTTNDDDRLIPAVRLIRPEKRTDRLAEGVRGVGVGGRRRGGLARRLGRRDRRRPTRGSRATWCWSRACCCRSGRACPTRRTSVRRLKAPDGRRWLGRVLDPGQVPQLKVALGPHRHRQRLRRRRRGRPAGPGGGRRPVAGGRACGCGGPR